MKDILGIIIGILGIIIAIVTYLKSKKIKQLEYSIVTTALISDRLDKYSKLKVYYGDEVIKAVNGSQIKITNTGSDIIEPNDFMPSSPLVITTTGKFLIENIDECEVLNSNDANIIHLTKIDNSHISIDFDCICLNDIVQITILHTGQISLSGRLKIGKIELWDNYIDITTNMSYQDKVTLSVSKGVVSITTSIILSLFIGNYDIISILIFTLLIFFALTQYFYCYRFFCKHKKE